MEDKADQVPPDISIHDHRNLGEIPDKKVNNCHCADISFLFLDLKFMIENSSM